MAAEPNRTDATNAAVLVVDDDPAIVEWVRCALEDAGYRVLSAVGARALSLARTERPNVILLDLLMPGMDGAEISHRLRADAETARIPIVTMSAHAPLRRNVSPLQIDDHLPKPFALAELYAMVARWSGAQHEEGPLAEDA